MLAQNLVPFKSNDVADNCGTNSAEKIESKIVTADVTSQLTENPAPVIAVPFCSHAIESVFHCFPFAELYSSDQNDAQNNIIR